MKTITTALIAAQGGYSAHAEALAQTDGSTAARLATAEASVIAARHWAADEIAAVSAAATAADARVPAAIGATTLAAAPSPWGLSPDARQGLADAGRRAAAALSALNDEAVALLLWRMRQSKLARALAVGALALAVGLGLYFGGRALVVRLAEVTPAATAAPTAEPTAVILVESDATISPVSLDTAEPDSEETAIADDALASAELLSPTSPDEIVVSAAEARTLTGIAVAAGQQVIVEYLDGEWRAGPLPTWPLVGPAGDDQVASKATLPVPDRPIMSLVAGVGDDRPRAVGRQDEFVAAAAGELWLGPNDDSLSDNAGQMLVRVTLRDMPESAAEPPMIEVSPLTGAGLIQLTVAADSDYTPTISPDQRRVVVSSQIDGVWQLVEVDVDGGGVTRALTSGGADYYGPDFSPDGLSILTSSDRDGDLDIYQLDSATGEVMAQLTDLPGDEYYPRWLRDGSGFVFSWQDNDIEAIYLSHMRGEPVELVSGPAFYGFASPSPDGASVAFYTGTDGDYEVYSMAIDGANPRRLTVSSGRDGPPAWSPDGQWLAFETTRHGTYDLYIMRADGRDARPLTSGSANDWQPSFSPDGQWVFFQSDRSGNMDVFRMPLPPP